MENKSTEERLKEISLKMSDAQADLDALSEEIDKLLGTGLDDQDEELNRLWQRNNRR